MKARLPLTAKEEKIVRFAVKKCLDKQVEDIVLRAQCLVLASMLNVGLSAKTVNRVVADLTSTTEEYGKFREDRIADYELIQGLINHGVNVHMTKEEL